MRSSNLRLAVALVLGLVLGWLFFGGSSPEPPSHVEDHDHPQASEPSEEEVWTCSMHPQIRRSEPGACPLCGMDLILAESGDSSSASRHVELSAQARMIASVETSRVQRSTPVKEIYFPGKVKADERRIVHLTARFGGRIEKLYVNFTGQRVRRGQKLLSIYSPELVTAQKELFEAARFGETRPAFYRAARNKLKLWDLTEEQIDAIEASGEAQFVFDVVSPINGTVTRRYVAEGHYTEQGTELLEVTDLSRVWVLFDAYESDLPWVQVGGRIDFSIRSLPSKTFHSTVTFIDPVVDPAARVAHVRTELDNSDDLLKPEMFATGVLRTELPRAGESLTVPKSAVLWTGKRAIVYVSLPGEEGTFEHREIGLGEDAGDYWVVTSGLEEGEEVVTNGVFKVDAAAQLAAKPSMMTPAPLGTPPPREELRAPTAIRTSMPAPAAATPSAPTSKNEGQHNPEPRNDTAKEQFQANFQGVLREYFALRDGLVQDTPARAATAAVSARQKIEAIDAELLDDPEQNVTWILTSPALITAFEQIAASSDIEQQRVAFADASLLLIDLLDLLDIKEGDDGPLYRHHCPMALRNQGAPWISETDEILNPYMGQAMLTCGIAPEPL